MKVEQLVCQKCGANLDVKDKIASCPCCGSTVFIDDESTTTTHNYNYTYRKIDEARIRENERKTQMSFEELKSKDKEKEREHQMQKWILIGSLIVMVVAFVVIGLMALSEKPTKNEVQMPCSASDYKGENYEIVVKELENLGFTNIEIAQKNDLITGWITKDGAVYKVSINGVSDFKEEDVFPKDAAVVVTYHTFKD